MKVGELITKLQELDPSGQARVCIGNESIWFPECKPAYWDGRLQVLTWGDKGHPISGTRTAEGSKIELRTLGLHDCFEYPGFTIEYESERDETTYGPDDKQAKEEHDAIMRDLDGRRAAKALAGAAGA